MDFKIKISNNDEQQVVIGFYAKDEKMTEGMMTSSPPSRFTKEYPYLCIYQHKPKETIYAAPAFGIWKTPDADSDIVVSYDTWASVVGYTPPPEPVTKVEYRLHYPTDRFGKQVSHVWKDVGNGNEHIARERLADMITERGSDCYLEKVTITKERL